MGDRRFEFELNITDGKAGCGVASVKSDYED